MRALPGFLTRNWTLKLSAFGIALLLWVSVRVEAPNRQALEGVPVRVDLTDPQWALVNGPEPMTATVRFTGPSRELIRMAVDRPTIVVPLDRVGSSDTTIVLRSQYVRIQNRPGVVVDDIQPQTIRLGFEAIRRLEMPVAIRMEGSLPEEWAFASLPVVDPAVVWISGPESRVRALDSIPLLAFDLSEVDRPGLHRANVDTTGFGPVQAQPSEVGLELRLEERIERVLGGIPLVIEMDGWAEEFEVEPELVAVTLSGARSLVDEVNPQQLRVVVELDLDDLPEEPGAARDFPVRLEGVPELVRGTPAVGEVTLRRLDDETEDPGEEWTG